MSEPIATPPPPPPRRKRRRGLKLAIGFLSFVTALGGVEIYYRIKQPASGSLPKPYENWPDRARWQRDHDNMPKTVHYYDYHLWSGPPYQSETINFDYYHGYPCVSRRVPDSFSPENCDLTVWLFGGSTMQHVGTTDEDTIASHVARALIAAGHKPLVVNFGSGGFTSSQEFVRYWDLLRRSSGRRVPDVAVFYDGYNDGLFGGAHGPGFVGEDYHSRMAALVTRRHGRLFWYLTSESLGEYSAAWRALGANAVRNSFYNTFAAAPADWGSQRAADAADIYVKNVQSIQGLSSQTIWGHRIVPLFLLQPLIMTKNSPTVWEQKVLTSLGEAQPRFALNFYDDVRERMKHAPNFVDLSSCLDGRMQDDFLDYGHVGPESGRPIGARIAQAIAETVATNRADAKRSLR